MFCHGSGFVFHKFRSKSLGRLEHGGDVDVFVAKIFQQKREVFFNDASVEDTVLPASKACFLFIPVDECDCV